MELIKQFNTENNLDLKLFYINKMLKEHVVIIQLDQSLRVYHLKKTGKTYFLFYPGNILKSYQRILNIKNILEDIEIIGVI